MILPISFFAQEKESADIVLHVDKTLQYIKAQNIVSTVVKINNNSITEFQGYLNIPDIVGLRNISRSLIPVQINSSDSTFIPVKFLIQPSMDAGNSPVLFNLLDSDKRILKSINSSFVMEERINLILNTEQNNLFITNQTDSVYVKTSVLNSGNKSQKVTVVFSIPTLMGNVNFVEQSAEIAPMKQHQFSLGFVPTKGLLDQQQFSVNISAMRGLKKDLFGNSIVHIHNILAEKQYTEEGAGYNQFFSSQKNALTARYRFFGSGNRSLQLTGMGDVDLSAGYLELVGNIYKANTDDQIVGTNTSVKYKLFENEFTLGNIYESLETTISGRGAKVHLEDGSKRSLQIGVVDENYNLFSTSRLFNEGYSVYAVGRIKDLPHFKNISTSLIHQYNPREQSLNNIVGGEANWLVNNWDITLALHGATSQIEIQDQNKASGASELRYRGKIKDYDLSGLYYISSDYFPGNRRGMMYLQQMLYKELKNKYSIRTNVLYSAISPKFFSTSRSYTAKYLNGDIELFTPKLQHVFLSIAYQTRYESSDAYKQNNFEVGRMNTHRLKESMRWNIPNSKHSIYMVLENGFANYPSNDQAKFQFKSSMTYSYDWLNFVGSYQSGSYYLSEHYLSERENKPFNRLILSASVNKDFSNNKYSINTGVSLTNDPFSKLSISAYSNLRYALSQGISLYLNGTWNSYKLNNTVTNNAYNIEVGFSLNLPSKKLSSKKKSKISTFVFYDKNSNGTFDAGDTAAENYSVKINNQTFRSASNGMVTYKGVPYGDYKVGQVSENGWFFDGDTIKANKSKITALVPLQQAGTIIGKIHYAYDVKSSVEIVPQLSGIIFRITNSENKTIQKLHTDSEGNFATFLPTGDYKIELVQSSLPQGAYCSTPERQIKISSGKIINLRNFEIGVRQKKVNMKYFTQ